jgi:hypothetical protein
MRINEKWKKTTVDNSQVTMINNGIKKSSLVRSDLINLDDTLNLLRNPGTIPSSEKIEAEGENIIADESNVDCEETHQDNHTYNVQHAYLQKFLQALPSNCYGY